MRKITLKALPATDQGVSYEFELDDGQKTTITVSHMAAVLVVKNGQTLKDYIIEQACNKFGLNPSEADIHGVA